MPRASRLAGQQVRGPKVLVKLRRALVKGDGLIEPNLFRQAPDEGELCTLPNHGNRCIRRPSMLTPCAAPCLWR